MRLLFSDGEECSDEWAGFIDFEWPSRTPSKVRDTGVICDVHRTRP